MIKTNVPGIYCGSYDVHAAECECDVCTNVPITPTIVRTNPERAKNNVGILQNVLKFLENEDSKWGHQIRSAYQWRAELLQGVHDGFYMENSRLEDNRSAGFPMTFIGFREMPVMVSRTIKELRERYGIVNGMFGRLGEIKLNRRNPKSFAHPIPGQRTEIRYLDGLPETVELELATRTGKAKKFELKPLQRRIRIPLPPADPNSTDAQPDREVRVLLKQFPLIAAFTALPEKVQGWSMDEEGFRVSSVFQWLGKANPPPPTFDPKHIAYCLLVRAKEVGISLKPDLAFAGEYYKKSKPTKAPSLPVKVKRIRKGDIYDDLPLLEGEEEEEPSDEEDPYEDMPPLEGEDEFDSDSFDDMPKLEGDEEVDVKESKPKPKVGEKQKASKKETVLLKSSATSVKQTPVTTPAAKTEPKANGKVPGKPAADSKASASTGPKTPLPSNSAVSGKSKSAETHSQAADVTGVKGGNKAKSGQSPALSPTVAASATAVKGGSGKTKPNQTPVIPTPTQPAANAAAKSGTGASPLQTSGAKFASTPAKPAQTSTVSPAKPPSANATRKSSSTPATPRDGTTATPNKNSATSTSSPAGFSSAALHGLASASPAATVAKQSQSAASSTPGQAGVNTTKKRSLAIPAPAGTAAKTNESQASSTSSQTGVGATYASGIAAPSPGATDKAKAAASQPSSVVAPKDTKPQEKQDSEVSAEPALKPSTKGGEVDDDSESDEELPPLEQSQAVVDGGLDELPPLIPDPESKAQTRRQESKGKETKAKQAKANEGSIKASTSVSAAKTTETGNPPALSTAKPASINGKAVASAPASKPSSTPSKPDLANDQTHPVITGNAAVPKPSQKSGSANKQTPAPTPAPAPDKKAKVTFADEPNVPKTPGKTTEGAKSATKPTGNTPSNVAAAAISKTADLYDDMPPLEGEDEDDMPSMTGANKAVSKGTSDTKAPDIVNGSATKPRATSSMDGKKATTSPVVAPPVPSVPTTTSKPSAIPTSSSSVYDDMPPLEGGTDDEGNSDAGFFSATEQPQAEVPLSKWAKKRQKKKAAKQAGDAIGTSSATGAHVSGATASGGAPSTTASTTVRGGSASTVRSSPHDDPKVPKDSIYDDLPPLEKVQPGNDSDGHDIKRKVIRGPNQSSRGGLPYGGDVAVSIGDLLLNFGDSLQTPSECDIYGGNPDGGRNEDPYLQFSEMGGSRPRGGRRQNTGSARRAMRRRG